MRHQKTVAAVALALAGTLARAEAPFSFADTPGKLPKDVIPLLYDAHLVPDVKADTFRGQQRVEIEVLRPTSRIVLNAANLRDRTGRLVRSRHGRTRADARSSTTSRKRSPSIWARRWRRGAIRWR